mmetsp:Transcript_47256/g.122131  ORF Transcript_47256/g.122131 Transcript_47256/m.122131 type:complete len:170 (+) Transcript_47256:310-819(+)
MASASPSSTRRSPSPSRAYSPSATNRSGRTTPSSPSLFRTGEVAGFNRSGSLPMPSASFHNNWKRGVETTNPLSSNRSGRVSPRRSLASPTFVYILRDDQPTSTAGRKLVVPRTFEQLLDDSRRLCDFNWSVRHLRDEGGVEIETLADIKPGMKLIASSRMESPRKKKT